jgi:pyruvate kinase
LPSRTAIRRTKIVATLGPVTAEPSAMAELLAAGVNVFRVNASHGTPESRQQMIADAQRVVAEGNEVGAILVDLHGPRIRVGTLPEPMQLEQGSTVVFGFEGEVNEGEIPTTYRELAGDVRPGTRILLNDGLLAVDVTRIVGDRVEATVRHGGELLSNKGMNLPGTDVSTPAVTDADREEIARAVASGVDYIGISFVRRPHEVEEIRSVVPKTMKLVAKIEKDTALDHMYEIVDVADVVMVARGDLGVELSYEEVPMVQKRLIRAANLQGKPVITATQMLESMVHAPRPTRAEASDVANAILDGTDAVMLSAETAIGKYPVLAVEAMDRIAREVEGGRQGRSPAFDLAIGRRGSAEDRAQVPFIAARPTTEDAIAVAVVAAAELLSAPLIVCFTSSGFTARTVAQYRPKVPVVAVTPELTTFRQLALVWGVVPILVKHYPNYETMLPVARERILARGLAKEGDLLVVTAGVPFDVPGTTNLLKIEPV